MRLKLETKDKQGNYHPFPGKVTVTDDNGNEITGITQIKLSTLEPDSIPKLTITKFVDTVDIECNGKVEFVDVTCLNDEFVTYKAFRKYVALPGGDLAR